MKDWQSQAHVKWECKYHVVIIPKYRRKVLYGQIRRRVGEILRELCQHRGLELFFGREVTVSAQWAGTNEAFENTSGSKRSSNKTKNSWGLN